MILGEGLFQADGHPGNILVQEGGRIALLDYGQSKQLEDGDKWAFADLIVAMNR
jgi:predicted unusual protein kinase regulating ubiquinone biosynthesis (AarF/ABC1/UbiB family)